MLNNLDFKKNFYNKKILIIGSSTGLGLACVKQYLFLGAHVFATSNNNSKNFLNIKKLYKNKFHFYKGDLNKITNTKNILNEYKKLYNNIDIIIHTLGGGFGLTSHIINHYDFLKLFNLNLAVGAEINRIFLDLFGKKGGNIMHVGSTASVQAIGSVGYNTVKTGLKAYVKTFSLKVSKKNIIVNSIMPGAFLAPDNHFFRKKKNDLQNFNKFQEKFVSKKISTYKDLMPMILLITSQYGKMTSGSNILIDNCETNTY